MSVIEITCPNCAIKFPMIAGMNDAAARQVAELMGHVPPKVAPLLLEYISMFKPPKSGLSWTRARKLLTELVNDIRAGQITRSGATWPAPPDAWQAALQECIDRRHKFTLPLNSHGYLYEILASSAEKAGIQKERIGTRPAKIAGSTGRSIGEINSEIKSLKNLIETSPNSASRDSLQRQIDKLEHELEGMR